MKMLPFTHIFVLIFSAIQIGCGQNPSNSNQNLSNANIEQITKQKTTQTNSDQRIENLKKQANETTQALVNGDYKKYAESVYVPSFIADKYPEKIKDFREKAALESKKQIDQLKSEGFNFEIVVDEPQAIVSGDNKLFSIVPTNNISRIKEGQEIKDVNGNNLAKGRYEMKGFMLGISQNSGETWQFMDVDNDSKQFELFFPEASKKLKLPVRTKPTYYPE